MKKKNVSLDKLNMKKLTIADANGGRPPYQPLPQQPEEKCISRPQVSCIMDWWP